MLESIVVLYFNRIGCAEARLDGGINFAHIDHTKGPVEVDCHNIAINIGFGVKQVYPISVIWQSIYIIN